jgi:hypothetical protein
MADEPGGVSNVANSTPGPPVGSITRVSASLKSYAFAMYPLSPTCTPRRGCHGADPDHCWSCFVPRLTPLPVTISLTLMTSVATHAEPIGTRTCARWMDGRGQHLSTTMETWVTGYLASSNQWALALGLAEAPVLVPELLKLIDQNCKSNPNARLANVVFDVIRSELLRGKSGQHTPSVSPR